MDLYMNTFYNKEGNFDKIPLSEILDRRTDDWIDDNITNANVSELRDVCKKMYKYINNLNKKNNLQFRVSKELIQKIVNETFVPKKITFSVKIKWNKNLELVVEFIIQVIMLLKK